MKQAVKYINKYVGIVDKPMRKAITLFVNKQWEKAYNLFHTDNERSEANLLAAFAKLYCAAQLESDTAEDDAQIVLNYTDFEFWAYLEEHNFPRYARRFALHFLAYLANEKANFDEAINFIDEALAIDSPIDDLDNVSLLETKINIFLFSKETLNAFSFIQKLLAIDPNNNTFDTIINSDTYKKYLEENDISALKQGKDNETAIEALERYKKFLKIYFEHDKDEIISYLPIFFAKIKASELEKVETEMQFKFPPSYRQFVLKKGLFRFGKWNDYESCLLKPKEMERLSDALAKEWSVDLDKELNVEQRKNLDNIITFSYGDEGLQMVWYYCFNINTLNPETGEMSVEEFSQDDWWYLTEGNNSIEQGKGFDKHISALVDGKIDYLLDS